MFLCRKPFGLGAVSDARIFGARLQWHLTRPQDDAPLRGCKLSTLSIPHRYFWGFGGCVLCRSARVSRKRVVYARVLGHGVHFSCIWLRSAFWSKGYVIMSISRESSILINFNLYKEEARLCLKLKKSRNTVVSFFRSMTNLWIQNTVQLQWLPGTFSDFCRSWLRGFLYYSVTREQQIQSSKMVKYFESSTVFQFSWEQVAQGFWRRYPNPNRWE